MTIHYDVYRGTTPGFPLDPANLVATVDNPPLPVAGLPDGRHYFRVVARDDAGNTSPPSVEFAVAIGTDLTAPSVPTGLTATAVGATRVELYWTDSTDAYGVANYDVLRGTAVVGTVADNAFTDEGLTASTSYTYTVRARDAASNVSAASEAVTVTTLAADPAPPVVSSAQLPFDMPARSVLVDQTSTAKQVRYHLFLPYPTSVDDKNGATDSTEYWRRKWLPSGGTEGTTNHAVYGGLVRARKHTRAPRGSGYQVKDYMDEVRLIIESGANGVWVDVLQLPHPDSLNPQRWQQLKYFLTAVANVEKTDGIDLTGFVGLMPDGSTSATKSAADLVKAFVGLNPNKYIWKPGGRLAVFFYQPEVAPAYANTSTPASASCISFHQAVVTGLKNALATDPLMGYCFSRNWVTYAPKFTSQTNGGKPLVDYLSRWGDRDPTAVLANNYQNAAAADYCHATFSKPWMHPVAFGDNRPRHAGFWEQRGTECLRNSWLAAMGLDRALVKKHRAADQVQLPTWDDLAEGTEFYPSPQNGSVWRDVSSFYMVRYKTGVWPAVKRDCIYLTHRVQFVSGTSYTGSQTKFSSRKGSTASVDEVEALVFTTAETGTVYIAVGGIETAFDVGPASPVAPGVYSFRAPLRAGAVSARYVRSGMTVASAASPHAVSKSQPVQDMSYRGVSSLRA